MEKLKPCPFCGHTSIKIKTTCNRIYVTCPRCLAKARGVAIKRDYGLWKFDQIKQEAIAVAQKLRGKWQA